MYLLPTCLPTWLVSVAAFAPALVAPDSPSAPGKLALHLTTPRHTSTSDQSRWYGFRISANRTCPSAEFSFAPSIFVIFSQLKLGACFGASLGACLGVNKLRLAWIPLIRRWQWKDVRLHCLSKGFHLQVPSYDLRALGSKAANGRAWHAPPSSVMSSFHLDECSLMVIFYSAIGENEMEPLSITTGCLALISTIGKTSSVITSFVRDCRDARHDLDAISRELTSLGSVLTLLKEDSATTKDQAIPETLRAQIVSVISNCSQVLTTLDDLLQKHNGVRVDKAARWVMTGRDDAAKLRSTLVAHVGALNLALDLLTLSVYL
jgi:hypothetical protein